jgi:hypothetical protein
MPLDASYSITANSMLQVNLPKQSVYSKGAQPPYLQQFMPPTTNAAQSPVMSPYPLAPQSSTMNANAAPPSMPFYSNVSYLHANNGNVSTNPFLTSMPAILPLSANPKINEILQPTTTSSTSNQQPINGNGSEASASTDQSRVNGNGSNGKSTESSKPHLASLINPADFETTTTSPFDDALLRSIDDRQELSSVFQQAYMTPTSSTFPNNN